MHPWPLLLLLVTPAASFSPHSACISRRSSFAKTYRTSSVVVLSAKKAKVKTITKEEAEEDDDEQRVSFEDAGSEIREEDDGNKVEAMGEYDTNPLASTGIDYSVRQAIKERTQKMGIEKSQATAEYIKRKNDEALAAANAADSKKDDDMFGGLDLSQVRAAGAGKIEEEDEFMIPFMASDGIDEEMDDDMKKEADPVGQLPLWEQAIAEIKETTWPTPVAALKRVVVVAALVSITVFVGVRYQDFVEDFLTNGINVLPTEEQIANAKPPPGYEDFYDNLAGFGEGYEKALESGVVKKIPGF